MPTKGDFVHHNMTLAVQTNDMPDGFIAGIASSPSIDCYGHRVLPGAFDTSIKQKGFNVGEGGIKLLDHHKEDGPTVGVIRKLETLGNNLRIEAELCLKSSRVRDLYEETKFCGGSGFSVGFRLEDYGFAKENGEEIFIIKSGELREVSLVNFPACQDARTHVVKNENDIKPWLVEMQDALRSLQDIDTVVELERALAAKGFNSSRNEAHKFFALMKSCAHLLQDKPALDGGAGRSSPRPLLDASMLKPALAELAKVQSLL